jgi:hypothetical protein
VHRKQLSLLIVLGLFLAAAGLLKAAAQSETAPTVPPIGGATTLDYDFFKAKVQPIFLLKRPGHARCFLCHADSNIHAPLKLVPLSPGATTWDEAQTRQNFEYIKVVAIAGDLQSPLLTHPLSPDAGGDFFHTGGRQFESQTDPSWLTFKAFILGEKLDKLK